MKFCYFDESGMGTEPILVTAAVVADAQRMHQTKAEWDSFLKKLSDVIGQTIPEFHARDFYRGRKFWSSFDGEKRAKIITAILDWVINRKHDITFSIIDKEAFEKRKNYDEYKDLLTPWCAGSIHCILGIQKYHQRKSRNKGHSVLIFDRETKEEKCLIRLVYDPADWMNLYYGKKTNTPPLNQIIDVPYFVDSECALLIQVADLIAYILRTFIDLEMGTIIEKYVGEKNRMKRWVELIMERTIPSAMRYPSKGRNNTEQFFWEIAPSVFRK